MKILLVYPPSQSLYGLPRYPMIGLTYLGTVLEKKGIKVKLLDMRLPKEDFNVLEKTLSSFKPEIVGVGSTTYDFPGAKKVFEVVKKINPAVKTILGGPHASVCTQILLQEKNIDHLFLGEGEKLLPKFLFKKTKKEKIINRKHIFPRDLNELSFPKWELSPLDEYKVRGKLTLPILTSRGCPYNCIYCASWRTHGKKFRFRSPKNVVDEFEHDIEKYKATNFSILDDNFALNLPRAIDICQEIIRRNLRITWGCDQGMRADKTSLKLFKLMKKSGCQLVALGVEHADQEILNNMQKAESIEVIRKSIGDAKKSGLIVKAFFIVGGPGDNLEKTKKSIEFFKETDVDIPRFSMMTAYPGTTLWEWVEKNGRFIGGFYQQFFRKPTGQVEVQFETKDFPKQERIKVFKIAEKEAEVWMIFQKLLKKIGPLTFLLMTVVRLEIFRAFLKTLYRLKLFSITD